MKHVYYLFTLSLIVACASEPESIAQESELETTNAVKKTNPEYTVLTVQNSTSDWGYQLLKDGQLMIDQKHIPAIQGNRGFSTKEDAENVANFILEKIKKGEFPPTVSVEELDSLGVL